MALKIELNGDKPGIVNLSAGKWTHGTNVEMMIQRNQDNFYLSQDNQWIPETYWHTVSDLTINDGYLMGKIGPWLTDSLLALGGNCKFLMQIRETTNPANVDRGVINIKSDVLSSNALSNDTPPETVPPIVEPEPEPVNESKEEEPVSESVPEVIEESNTVENEEPITPAQENTAPVAKKSNIKKLIVILLALIILLGLAYFLYKLFMPPVNNINDDINNNIAGGACELSSQQENDDDMNFISGCLRTKPSTEQLLQLITDAKAQGKCNLAQRLYANQSQKDAKIGLVYAKEYDEKFYQKNDCFAVDKETAKYWYETVLILDPNNDVAKKRLSELNMQ